ncbi:hypothetical protein [Micromonospora sp. LOL_023]|uniref:hypothetical protein n=1 Tax=Micromonospora sp. LOL_023 TaxID=3345418 RepID=UPI003A88FDC8
MIRVDLTAPATAMELANELRGLSTMHSLVTPRIFPLPEFHTGSRYANLVKQVTG